MRIPELLVPVVAGGMLLVRFALEVAAVVVGLVIWERWIKRR